MIDFFKKPQGPFTPEVLKAAGLDAAARNPEESCGLVIAGKYVACENIAANRQTNFKIAPAIVAKANAAGTLEGVIHSHPGGPWHPTSQDMRSQQASGVPWAILIPGEDGAELACVLGGDRPPLFDESGNHIQRQFLHGVSDCYSLIRDWFAEIKGVDLPDVPRDWLWWRDADRKQSLYLDHLEDAGGRIVSTDPTEYAKIIEPGDVFLRKVDGPIPNHGGVYVGGNLVLEQMPRSLSHRSPIGPKLHVISHLVRLK